MRRERALLVLRIAARTALLALAVLAATVVASVIHLDRGAATMVVVALAGIGGWIAVALPLLLEWRATGDTLRQARRVEALRPFLRGRLITAVGHGDGPDGATSPDLLALVVRRAAEVVGGIGASEVHDARKAVGWAGAASVLWAIGLPVLLLVSGGPAAVLEFWLAGSSASARVSDLSVEAPVDVARVGDLIIRYTYPDYTGLQPKEIPQLHRGRVRPPRHGGRRHGPVGGGDRGRGAGGLRRSPGGHRHRRGPDRVRPVLHRQGGRHLSPGAVPGGRARALAGLQDQPRGRSAPRGDARRRQARRHRDRRRRSLPDPVAGPRRLRRSLRVPGDRRQGDRRGPDASRGPSRRGRGSGVRPPAGSGARPRRAGADVGGGVGQRHRVGEQARRLARGRDRGAGGAGASISGRPSGATSCSRR